MARTAASSIVGVGLTAFADRTGWNTLDLMAEASVIALQDAGLERSDVDAVLCGYSTTYPHIMLSSVFAEHFGLRPRFAEAIQLGGATAGAMVASADSLIRSGLAERVLVVAGENRLTGQSRDTTVQALANIGHPVYEVPLGPTVPAYYALLASVYLHRHRGAERGLAELAVAMRAHAARHPGAHMRVPLTVDDVLESRLIADPLKLLDCCPVSDGGAAVVVAREPLTPHAVSVLGIGEAHEHQHISAAVSLSRFGAGRAYSQALERSGVAPQDIGLLEIYDSFTITLALLLEELGFAAAGDAGRLAQDGAFALDGPLPLNTHGGLLSYGHCGVAGGFAHIVEACVQLSGRGGVRQASSPKLALVHADGGVLSSHVSLILAPIS